MTLPLTKGMLAAAYDYLCMTPPFVRWNLPDSDSDDVKFVVGRMRRDFAKYGREGDCHVITLSRYAIGHTRTLLEKLGHEMIHMHLEQMGWESRRGGKDTHNPAFRKFAAQACKAHGWDLRAFF